MGGVHFLRRALPICLMSFVLAMFFSCKSDIEKDTKALCSRPVRLHTDKMQCVYPMLKRDSALYHINDGGKPYRLVVSLDSAECMSCATEKMHGWDEFLSEVSLDGKVSCFFIFSPKKEEKDRLHALLVMERLEYPVYIDSTGVFTHENPHIPQAPMMHTFLINGKGKVVFVGDPRRDMKLNKLFYKTIGRDS